MKRIFALLAVAAGLLPFGAALADGPLTVVELYTSQGCSSCPPADRLAGELTKRKDVLPLSLHVDYWDYIGWKDPFARAEHTERQRAYSRQFNLRYVYTPQMVVDGTFQASGGNPSDIYAFIEKSKALPHVPVKLVRGAAGLKVALPEFAVDGSIDVISVFADRRHETRIKKGENGGQTLAYHNVVRDMQSIGAWRGEAREIDIPMSEAGGEICAVILQDPTTRRIIGAAKIALDRS